MARFDVIYEAVWSCRQCKFLFIKWLSGDFIWYDVENEITSA
jgi:hypothetical protein